MKLLLDGGRHKDGADVPGRAAQDCRHQAVVGPLPQKHLEQALRAHADGPLHTDLRHPGVDVGVDCVDNVQKADQRHKQDQAPGQKLNLLEALRQLTVGVLVGQPESTGSAPRQGLQHSVKVRSVNPLRQGGQQLVILRFPREGGIQLLVYNNLYSIDKAVVSDTQIA